MSYFPCGDEEMALLRFISNYQYLKSTDAKYFFKSKWYYYKRIANLVDKEYIKRIKNNLVLDTKGIDLVNIYNFKYIEKSRNPKYVERLINISHFAVYYINTPILDFTPSFNLKDDDTITNTSRRYIGIANINDYEYLVYYIPSNADTKYLVSVVFDIQKERNFRNIIIVFQDMTNIDINNFTFGLNSVLLINDNEKEKEDLKYIHSIDWHKVIQTHYKNSVYLSEYNFCDYTDYQNKYVAYFYFIDTEKINRIKYFLRENVNRQIDILCPIDIKPFLKKEIPTANFIDINLEDYIEKEQRIYS